MNISLKKIWFKFTNKQKYQDYKTFQKKEKNIKIFKDKYENEINSIQKKINEKRELSFLHSGHSGDIINALPVIKELSKTHKCNLYIQVNKPMLLKYYKHPAGNVLVNKKIFDMLLPLLKSQKYINNIEQYNNQNIDINFDIIRDLPCSINFDNSRWFFHIAGVQTDLTQPYLLADSHKLLKNKIVIIRTFRYRNYFINYNFLNDYKNLLFIGIKDEYDDLKKQINNLEYHDCKDFLEMATIIKACKFFIGNQSLGYDLAEALKTPRLLEGCPYFPVIKPHGSNAYDFFYQAHFEKFFKILNEK